MSKRKIIFVDKQVQGSYMLMTGLSVFFTGLCVGVTTYCLMFNSLAEQMGTLNLAKFDFQIVTESDIPRFIAVLAAIIGLSILTSLFFLFYTHRIVGPIKRMQAAFETAGRGDFSVRLRLRQKDLLVPLAESFNKMAEQLQDKCISK
ncbi:MAG: HAMP domain-containing protein [Candidatus Omnitrophota bacterium]